jgi:ABC-2 type transport system ATP-binding protein
MGVIEATGLTKYYGETRGVEDLTFSVEQGEVFGFLGPNGAGKTTAIRALMGFQAPTGGSAQVLGHSITDERAMQEARADIGYLPSNPGLDETVTGRRLLEYYGSLRGDERSEELLELFTPPLDRTIGEYSTGNKQMLALILAFMHDPELIIMDEPTSGLDPLKQERLYEFIHRERERGVTFFFSSHILSEVRKVCSRVGIIRDGKLVELEDIQTLLHRSGKTITVRLADAVDVDGFDLDGVHDVSRSVQPRHEAAGQATTLSFTYTGDYNSLLSTLSKFQILDLEIEEAPLEDVFMRFYGGDDSGDRVESLEATDV